MDGDGDQDVLATVHDFVSNTWWYPNVDGQGTFGQGQLISTRGDFFTGDDVGGPDKVTAADLDGDGDLDVLAALFPTEEGIDWYENIDEPGTFGPSRIIDAELHSPSCAVAADLDADGDLDVLAASRLGDVIAWYENTDGRGNYGPQVVITAEEAVYYTLFATDLDGDGDQDFLGTSRPDVIFWHRNDSVIAPRADFNSDGLVDSDDFLLWQAGFGMQTGATLNDGDADTDGDVDGNDCLVWQASFGTAGGAAGSVAFQAAGSEGHRATERTRALDHTLAGLYSRREAEERWESSARRSVTIYWRSSP